MILRHGRVNTQILTVTMVISGWLFGAILPGYAQTAPAPGIVTPTRPQLVTVPAPTPQTPSAQPSAVSSNAPTVKAKVKPKPKPVNSAPATSASTSPTTTTPRGTAQSQGLPQAKSGTANGGLDIDLPKTKPTAASGKPVSETQGAFAARGPYASQSQIDRVTGKLGQSPIPKAPIGLGGAGSGLDNVGPVWAR